MMDSVGVECLRAVRQLLVLANGKAEVNKASVFPFRGDFRGRRGGWLRWLGLRARAKEEGEHTHDSLEPMLCQDGDLSVVNVAWSGRPCHNTIAAGGRPQHSKSGQKSVLPVTASVTRAPACAWLPSAGSREA